MDDPDLAYEIGVFFESLMDQGVFERAEALALTHQWFEITCLPVMEERDGP